MTHHLTLDKKGESFTSPRWKKVTHPPRHGEKRWLIHLAMVKKGEKISPFFTIAMWLRHSFTQRGEKRWTASHLFSPCWVSSHLLAHHGDKKSHFFFTYFFTYFHTFTYFSPIFTMLRWVSHLFSPRWGDLVTYFHHGEVKHLPIFAMAMWMPYKFSFLRDKLSIFLSFFCFLNRIKIEKITFLSFLCLRISFFDKKLTLFIYSSHI